MRQKDYKEKKGMEVSAATLMCWIFKVNSARQTDQETVNAPISPICNMYEPSQPDTQ